MIPMNFYCAALLDIISCFPCVHTGHVVSLRAWILSLEENFLDKEFGS